MKLKLFTILLILFISCKNETRTNSNYNDFYKKKIIELNIHFENVYEYEFRFGQPDEKTKFLVEHSEYDKNGNLIKKGIYYSNKNLAEYEFVHTFSYDDKGNHIETIEKNLKGEVKSIDKYKIEKGLITESVEYNPNGEITNKTIFKYDNYGNWIEVVFYDESGKIKSKRTRKFNDRNEEIEQISYNKDGEIESIRRLVELKDGWKKYQIFNEKNELESEYLFVENENGGIIESIWKNIKENSENKTITEFDENGLELKITKFENNGEPQILKIIERVKY
jgi:antitoxin component YwqK of YwqJK toxin-antitoxin module